MRMPSRILVQTLALVLAASAMLTGSCCGADQPHSTARYSEIEVFNQLLDEGLFDEAEEMAHSIAAEPEHAALGKLLSRQVDLLKSTQTSPIRPASAAIAQTVTDFYKVKHHLALELLSGPLTDVETTTPNSTRTYVVDDLLHFMSVPVIIEKNLHEEKTVHQSDSTSIPQSDPTAGLNQLITEVQTTINPSLWATRGGTANLVADGARGAIRAHCPAEIHRLIAAYIDLLRDGMREPSIHLDCWAITAPAVAIDDLGLSISEQEWRLTQGEVTAMSQLDLTSPRHMNNLLNGRLRLPQPEAGRHLSSLWPFPAHFWFAWFGLPNQSDSRISTSVEKSDEKTYKLIFPRQAEMLQRNAVRMKRVRLTTVSDLDVHAATQVRFTGLDNDQTASSPAIRLQAAILDVDRSLIALELSVDSDQPDVHQPRVSVSAIDADRTFVIDVDRLLQRPTLDRGTRTCLVVTPTIRLPDIPHQTSLEEAIQGPVTPAVIPADAEQTTAPISARQASAPSPE